MKLPGATVLNKSNTSIANMTKSQREDYVSQKLLELKNISEMYDKSGGQNHKVRMNVEKM